MKRRTHSKHSPCAKNQLDLFAPGAPLPAAQPKAHPVARTKPASVLTRHAKTTPEKPTRLEGHQAHTETNGGKTNGLLDVREAAAYVGLSKSTLDKMRCYARGPRYVKLTSAAVRYDAADLDAWIEGRRTSPT